MTRKELNRIEANEAKKKEDAFDAILAANKARKQYDSAAAIRQYIGDRVQAPQGETQ